MKKFIPILLISSLFLIAADGNGCCSEDCIGPGPTADQLWEVVDNYTPCITIADNEVVEEFVHEFDPEFMEGWGANLQKLFEVRASFTSSDGDNAVMGRWSLGLWGTAEDNLVVNQWTGAGAIQIGSDPGLSITRPAHNQLSFKTNELGVVKTIKLCEIM